MAEKLDPRQVVTFEELLRAMMFETEATRRILVRKGLLTNEEVLEEIKAVRRDKSENGCKHDHTDKMHRTERGASARRSACICLVMLRVHEL